MKKLMLIVGFFVLSGSVLGAQQKPAQMGVSINPIFTIIQAARGNFGLDLGYELNLFKPVTLMRDVFLSTGGSAGVSSLVLGLTVSGRYYFLNSKFQGPADPLEGLFASGGLTLGFSNVTTKTTDPFTSQETTVSNAGFLFGMNLGAGYKYFFSGKSGFYIEPLAGFSYIFSGAGDFWGGLYVGYAF